MKLTLSTERYFTKCVVALVTKYLGKIWYTVERQGATNGTHFRLDFARAWVFNKMENNSVNRNDYFTVQNEKKKVKYGDV